MHDLKWISVLLAALLAACAQQPAHHATTHHPPTTIDYAKYAQETLPWLQFNSLYDWRSTNRPGSVVIWTTPSQAYLLTLAGPCLGLQNAVGIVLTSHFGLVNSNHDEVVADGEHCRIIRIQRLDARAIRALRQHADDRK